MSSKQGRLPHVSRIYRFQFLRVIGVRLSQVFWSELAILLILAIGYPAAGGEIHDAVNNGDLEKVRALLKQNLQLVDSKDANGFTPLQLAARKGHKGISDLLLNNGASIGVHDNKDKSTALFIASRTGHADIVELLLSRKADIGSQNWLGDTPLHGAVVQRGNKKVVLLLLQNKADVNARNFRNSTPLYLLSLNSWNRADAVEVAQILLAHGADVNARSMNGQTPLHKGLDETNKALADFLRQHGAHK